MNKYKICESCGSTLEYKQDKHCYLESGLNKIYLNNVFVAKCKYCTEKYVSIGYITELHKKISELLIKKYWSLTGNELRFLRKNINFSTTLLSTYIGITNNQILDYEKSKTEIPLILDRLIRCLSIIINKFEVENIRDKVLNDIENIDSEKERDGELKINLTYNFLEKDMWTES